MLNRKVHRGERVPICNDILQLHGVVSRFLTFTFAIPAVTFRDVPVFLMAADDFGSCHTVQTVAFSIIEMPPA